MAFDSEYSNLTDSSLLFDLSSRTKILVSGPERAMMLNNLVSNDLLTLKKGKAIHSLFLDRFGKVLADAWIYDRGEDLLIEANELAHDSLLSLISKYASLAKVTVKDETKNICLLSLQGKTALSYFDSLAAYDVFSRKRAAFEGLDVFLSPEQVLQVTDKLGLSFASLDILESARIEAGVLEFGKDLTPASLAVEGGLTDAISYTKGCYVGQEVISRMHNLHGKTPFVFAGFTLQGSEVPLAGTEVLRGTEEVGKVTSSCFSPRFGKPLLIARVKNSGFEGLSVNGINVENVSLNNLP